MIRDMINPRRMVITVKLKTGEIFEKKDVTSSPCGNAELVVSFWLNDKIRVYPLQDIEYYEMEELIP